MQRLRQRMTRSREKLEDLEAQNQSAIHHLIYNKRSEFVQLLFGIKPEALADFPGIESYCDYLEHDAFQPLVNPTFDSIWDLIHSKPREIADCWDWSLVVLQVIQSNQPEASIHDILQRLKEHGVNVRQRGERGRSETYLHMAIFGVLCWSSLVVRPRLTFPDNITPSLTCLLPQGFRSAKSYPTHKLNDRCMRPILSTFRSFKLQHWGDRSNELPRSETRETDNLYQASLNMYSLRLFGHVTIEWVDTVSEHLRFNPANRRLSLFRFPTFCALFAIHGGNVCEAIRSITEELDPLPSEERDLHCVSFEQEIIPSYRLLFAQDGKSRKMAHEELRNLKDMYPKQSVDTMLSDLCERKLRCGSVWWKRHDRVLQRYPPEIWPITCRSMDGSLQQSDVYSARDDFPRLGQRLIRLQQFNLRQSPNRLRDLWRDRRNPLQWYTFWAVLLVGGVANILAILQLLVAVIELQTSL